MRLVGERPRAGRRCGQRPWQARLRRPPHFLVGVVRLGGKRDKKARVTVTLKSGILDPQGKAIEGALKSLGVDGVASVRQGKVFDIELDGADKAKAEARSRRRPRSCSPTR